MHAFVPFNLTTAFAHLRHAAGLTAALTWLLACSPAATTPVPCEPQSEAATPARNAAAASTSGKVTSVRNDGKAPRADDRPSLTLRLTPHGTERWLDVGLTLERANTASLLVARLPAERVTRVAAEDEKGPLEVTMSQADAGVSFAFKRMSQGTLRVSYRLAASSDIESTQSLAVAVDPERMRVAGEGVVALPPKLDSKAVHVTLRIDTEHVRGERGASSFGIGREHSFVTQGRKLRRGLYVAGNLGTAHFVSDVAKDTSVYLGQFGFSPRQIAADMAVLRGQIGQALGLRDPLPMTMIWMTDARPSGRYLVTKRAGGLLVGVSAGEPWSASLRIAVATAITQRWLGGRLWLKPSEGASAADTFWFSEGVARWFAASALLHSGLLGLGEYADEVNGLLGVTTTSKQRQLGQSDLSAHYGKTKRGLPLMVARGALYALELDARLRDHKKPTLERVLATLLRQKIRDRGATTLAEWHQAVKAAGAGKSPESLHDAWLIRGERPKPTSGALGPCYRLTSGTYDVYGLGFDAAATMRSKERRPVRLDPSGPAARAGLRPTDRVEFVYARPGETSVDARVAVKRGSKIERLRYRPVTKQLKGPRFARSSDRPDHECGW